MRAWTADELNRIGSAEEIDIAARRGDGTLRRPVTIWVVPYDDGLYVRSVRGPGGAWYQGTQETREGQIRADGIDKDVRFEDADQATDHQIDAAYREKYHRYPANILNSILTTQARATTTRLVPR